MRDDIIQIIEKDLHGVSEDVLRKIARGIEKYINDIDEEQRLVDVELLEEILRVIEKLTSFVTNITPQTTEDVIWHNDLNQLKYKLEIIIKQIK